MQNPAAMALAIEKTKKKRVVKRKKGFKVGRRLSKKGEKRRGGRFGVFLLLL
jgi:hypothetical protein